MGVSQIFQDLQPNMPVEEQVRVTVAVLRKYDKRFDDSNLPYRR